MTVSTVNAEKSFAGNDAATSFSLGFEVPQATDLVVKKRVVSTGAETELTLDTDYTVSNLGNEAGAVVNYPISGSPLASGEQLIVARILPITQDTSIENQTGFYPSVLEDAYDRLTMIAQQLDAEVSRAAKMPMGSSVEDPLFPAPDAGKALVWNSAEDGFENGPTATEIGNAQGYATDAKSYRDEAEAAFDQAHSEFFRVYDTKADAEAALGDTLTAQEVVVEVTSDENHGGHTTRYGVEVEAEGVPGNITFTYNLIFKERIGNGPDFATVAAFAADVTAGYTAPNGTVVTAGPVQFQADSSADISGLPSGWKPFGNVTPDHWKDNATPGTTDMRSAMVAALDTGYSVYLLDGNYLFSSGITVSKNYQRIIGTTVGGGGAGKGSNVTFTTGGFTFSDSEPDNGTINRTGLQNIRFNGGGNTSDWAIHVKRANAFYMDGVSWEGYYHGLLIEGGQNYFLSNWQHRSPGGASTVSGSAAIRIKEYTTAGGTDIKVYKVYSDGFTITGGSNFGTEFGIDDLMDDNNIFQRGYISRCGKSTIKLGGGDLPVFQPQFTNIYCDQTKFQSAGGDNALYLPNTGTGGVEASFVNVIFGQCSGAGFDVTKADARLKFDGCVVTNCDGGVGDIDGAQFLSISGSSIRNSLGGLTLNNVNRLCLSGVEFDNVTTEDALTISGTVDDLEYSGVSFVDCTDGELSVTAAGWSQKPVAQWYSEDTYTPVISFGGGTTGITYSEQSGNYTRVGDVVFFRAKIVLTSKGTDTGNLKISLPVTPAADYPVSVRLDNTGSALVDANVYAATEASLGIRIYVVVAGGATAQITDSELEDDSAIILSGHYQV